MSIKKTNVPDLSNPASCLTYNPTYNPSSGNLSYGNSTTLMTMPNGMQGPVGNTGPVGNPGITGVKGKDDLQSTPHAHFYKGALELFWDFHRIEDDEYNELYQLLRNNETLMLAIKKLDKRKSELYGIHINCKRIPFETKYECKFLGASCSPTNGLIASYTLMNQIIPMNMLNKLPLIHSLAYYQDDFYDLIKENNK